MRVAGWRHNVAAQDAPITMDGERLVKTHSKKSSSHFFGSVHATVEEIVRKNKFVLECSLLNSL